MTGLTLAATALAVLVAAPPGVKLPSRSRLHVPGVGGDVAIFAPARPPSRTVVLVSGDTGLDAGIDQLAMTLALDGSLVAAVDLRAYLASRPQGRCVYPAGDLEELAQHVEKVRQLPTYQHPVLVGWSRGAGLAWAALAQAPGGTFVGAVSIAPCAHEPLPVRLCAGAGPPARKLDAGELPALAPPPGPMTLVVGASDDRCRAKDSEALAGTLGARVVPVAGAGHAVNVALAVAAQTAVRNLELDARATPLPASAPAVADLPLVEVPTSKPGRRLAILLTGDGGWVGADKGLAAALADAGVPTVGLDSLRYFWKRRTPEETAADVGRIVAHYRIAWDRPEVLLVGYSRGADIVPVLAGRLPPEERARVKLVAMLGPSTFAELEVHAIDLFTSKKRSGAIPTEDAVRATAGAVPMLCVHGSEEHDSLCPRLADLPWVKDVLREGGHRLHGDDAAGLVREILDAAR